VKIKLPKFTPPTYVLIFICLTLISCCVWTTNQLIIFNQNSASLGSEIESLRTHIVQLESEDQRARNKELSDTMDEIKNAYIKSVSVYEELLDLKTNTKLNENYAKVVSLLAAANYSEANTLLDTLENDIAAEQAKSVVVAPAAAGPESNTPPSSGYSRQTVTTDAGKFTVSLVSGDLSNTKVIVDTASDSDCRDNCPVLPLATYISRNGAFAGINGSYFCPASYPTCAGKTNSFDLLAMNKNKTYFNSDNNVYSSNPAVIFGNGYVRFVTAASQWGRDTGVDGVLSNYPLLIHGSNVVFGGNDDPKQGSKGNRSFVANKANTVYIGVVHNATVAESARALKALGMENGMNLDSGGSTALWSGGYKLGPGRDLPNVILFVRK
jgi:hypothetical protein